MRTVAFVEGNSFPKEDKESDVFMSQPWALGRYFIQKPEYSTSVRDASRDTCNFGFLRSDRSLVPGKSSYKAEWIFRTDTTENHSSLCVFNF